MFTVLNVASLSLKFTPRQLGIQLVLGILSLPAYKNLGKFVRQSTAGFRHILPFCCDMDTTGFL